MNELTIQDVSNMVAIIDQVATRGAFRGEELAGVGALRVKLAQVVQDAVDAEAAAAAQVDKQPAGGTKGKGKVEYARDAVDAG